MMTEVIKLVELVQEGINNAEQHLTYEDCEDIPVTALKGKTLYMIREKGFGRCELPDNAVAMKVPWGYPVSSEIDEQPPTPGTVVSLFLLYEEITPINKKLDQYVQRAFTCAVHRTMAEKVVGTTYARRIIDVLPTPIARLGVKTFTVPRYQRASNQVDDWIGEEAKWEPPPRYPTVAEKIRLTLPANDMARAYDWKVPLPFGIKAGTVTA